MSRVGSCPALQRFHSVLASVFHILAEVGGSCNVQTFYMHFAECGRMDGGKIRQYSQRTGGPVPPPAISWGFCFCKFVKNDVCVRAFVWMCVRTCVCVCTATKPFRGARVSGVRSREKKIQETRPRLSAATCASMHRTATTTHRQATIFTVASHDLTTATRVPDTATLRPTTIFTTRTLLPVSHGRRLAQCVPCARTTTLL
jgi:hypothetical protein